jgi:S1-C subfamily serine protease
VDGHSVSSAPELIDALPKDAGGHDVNLTVTREKKELKLKTTL